MISEEKLKALNDAMAQIEKTYGKGSVMKLGDENAHMNVEAIPTGSLSLDLALGVGGLPRGRVIEIYGPESSGKTTVALRMIAEAQKRDGIAGFIDAEHALDPRYAKNIGVDIDNLYISQPDNGEQALEIAEAMVRSGALDIIVIDSVAALVPKAEIDGEMGDMQVGLQARLMSKALRKLTAVISKFNCTVIFINQLREKVGISYGNPEVTTGGRALKFYSSVRLEVRRGFETGRRSGREPCQDQGCKKQGGAAVSGDRGGYHLRTGAVQRRRYSGFGGKGQHCGEERILVCLQRRKDGSGPGSGEEIPEGEPRDYGGNRDKSTGLLCPEGRAEKGKSTGARNAGGRVRLYLTGTEKKIKLYMLY